MRLQTADAAQEFNRAVLEEYDGPIELEEALERGPDAVADCMIRQGFEYIAETQPVLQGSTQVPADDDLSRGWVETYGFGGSTLVFGDEQTAFLAGYDSSSLVEAAISSPDQSYQESLGPEELRAYEAALYGDVEPPDLAGLSSDEMQERLREVERAGCVSLLDTRSSEERYLDEVLLEYS